MKEQWTPPSERPLGMKKRILPILVQEDARMSEHLAELAKRLPLRRVINRDHDPYLSRYTLHECVDGGHVYLHYFHRGDADHELHNHPWAGTSVILSGGYVEERREPDGAGGYRIVERMFGPGGVNIVEPDTFHRIDLIDPVKGCWTLFSTSKRVQSWGFWDRNSGVFTPWREMLAARGIET